MYLKKQYLFLSILCCISTFLFAQTGTIKGRVTTLDAKSASNITISLEPLKRNVITDASGNYIIKNIKQGSYTVNISAIGIAAQQKEITISDNEIIIADFVINETAKKLEAIIINTHTQRLQNNAVTAIGKMPLTNLENPQVYNSVSAVIIKQQAIVNYDDAMRNVPGISRTWGSTGRGGDGASYFALRGFEAQPALYNGMPGLTNGNLDPANIEEIQIIKGPSATLYGGSVVGYGGLINTVTKKPFFDFGGEASYNIGSFGLHKFTADINTPIGKNKKAAFRLNTTYHTEKNFQDAGFKKSFFVAPSFVYKPNDKLTVQVLAEIMKEERAIPAIFFHTNRADEMTFKTIDELNLNPKISFISNDLTINNPRFNIQAQALYQISNQWSSQTIISANNNKSRGYYTYIYEDVVGDNNFGQSFSKTNFAMTAIDAQQNFNGDFKIGGLRNRVVMGIDFLDRQTIDKSTGSVWGRNVTPQGGENFIDPYTGETKLPIMLTKTSINNLLDTLQMPVTSNIANYSYSAYASDALNITPRLSLMLSLRADYFNSKGEKTKKEDDYNQWALSPKFGLVYEPILDKISLFANYMNGFVNVAPQLVLDSKSNENRVQSFKPEHAEQFEVGTKANLLSGKLFATLSAYNIKVKNKVTGDENGYSQKGTVGSKGFELDVNALLFPSLNIIAGYSFNEIKVIVGDDMDFYSQPGRAPGGQGPQHLANIWGNYKLIKGPFKGLGLGLGGNYAGIYKVVDNSATGVFNLPAYALLNASVFYEASKFRVAVNVNNITNTEYYIGYWSVNPQQPRNFVASFSYRF